MSVSAWSSGKSNFFAANGADKEADMTDPEKETYTQRLLRAKKQAWDKRKDEE